MRLAALVSSLALLLIAAGAVMPASVRIAHADEGNLCYQPVFDPKTVPIDTGARPGFSRPTMPITFTLVREDGSSNTEIYYPNPASWGPRSGTVVYESTLAAQKAGATGTVTLRPKVDWNSMFWFVAAPADFTTTTIISGVDSYALADNNGFPRSSTPQNNLAADSQGAGGIPAAFLTPDARGGYHGFLTTDAVKGLLPHVGTLPGTFQFEMQIPACAPDPAPPAQNTLFGIPALGAPPATFRP